MNNKKGFTLIEVLTVVAIIGLLSSIVLVGLSSFRSRGRDARRIADVHEVQTALELFHTKRSQYPDDASWANLEKQLKSEGIGVTKLPKDPSSNRTGFTDQDQYGYKVFAEGQKYILRAKLEDPNNPALNDDIDSADIPGVGIDCNDPYYCLQF